MNKNIFEIWKDNGEVIPFAVRRNNWSSEYYTVVEKIEIKKWPYGNAYGYPTKNGIYSNHYEYSREWKENKIIPCAGSFQWSLVPNAVLSNSAKSTALKISKVIIYECDSIFQFGKYNGKSLKNVYQENPDYVFWCIRNIQTFYVTLKVLQELQDTFVSVKVPIDIVDISIKRSESIENILKANERCKGLMPK